MATISPSKPTARFMILVHCAACGNIHAVTFATRVDFNALQCKQEHATIFTSAKTRDRIYKEFRNDVLSGAVAV